MQDFLPVTKKEMKERGWNQVDFVYISGDAYVDPVSYTHLTLPTILLV